MNTYTAKQIAEALQKEEPGMNLRTVRYYTQLGLLPSLELVGNKRVYTDKHMDYFRAILMLSRSGETLAKIQAKLDQLTPEEVARLGNSLRFYQPQQMLTNENHLLSEDVMLSISPRIAPELRNQMIEAVNSLLKGEKRP